MKEKIFYLVNEKVLQNAQAIMQERLAEYLNNDRDEKFKYEVLIRKFSHESREQQKGYWWLCGILGDETGYDKESIDEMVLNKIMDRKVSSLTGEEIKVMPLDENREKITRKKLYSLRIETLYRMATEAGFYLPELKR